jgi:hypothetical protein
MYDWKSDRQKYDPMNKTVFVVIMMVAKNVSRDD